MRIRMLQERTGPRWDGQAWPPVGGEITVPGDEGAALCAHGIAVPVADSDPGTPGEPAVEIRSGAQVPEDPGPDDGGGFLPQPVPGAGVPDQGTVARPIVNAPKSAWVDFATSIGFDRGVAEGMTKADLIGRFKDVAGAPDE